MPTHQNRIDRVFAEARTSGRAALLVYLTAGYPDAAASRSILSAIAAEAPLVDLLEWGIPFSDPIADGPVIQRASTVALNGGMTLDLALSMLAEFRALDDATAAILFGAVNPFLARGYEAFAIRAASAGADGVLAADVPVEEAAPLRGHCLANGLHLISLVAPTTPTERAARIADASSGFLYCIARKGVTGAQRAGGGDAAEYLARLRHATALPLALGFGISTPEHVAAATAAGADGVVVGTAVIQEIDRARDAGEDVPSAVVRFLRSLREATARG
ncbi:MAG: tryptophan synthase subunit alpha [Candidatus Sumerlaeia bacterium]|nr:tryptophan synthase subunit alpha [Candidatus Sumerlaeia bacterium]